MEVVRKLLVVSCTALVWSCSNDNGGDKSCTAHAAFDLSLRTADNVPLPDDTALRVDYHSGTETYQLNEDHTSLQTVLCDALGEINDASTDAGPKSVESLRCKLWTNGGAKVIVTASGYPDVTRALEATEKNDCIQTVSVELVLGDTDGGS